jgi:hypothetical protein
VSSAILRGIFMSSYITIYLLPIFIFHSITQLSNKIALAYGDVKIDSLAKSSCLIGAP